MRMIVRPALAAAILFGLIAPLAPAPAKAADMDKAQVEKIIRDYLVENPEVIIEAIEAWQEKERARMSEESRETIKQMAKDLKDDPYTFVAGNPDGDVTLYEFFDYNCGYCKASLPTLLQLLEDDKNLRLVLIELPIISETSGIASAAAMASIEQGGYFAFHQALMTARGKLSQGAILQIAREHDLDADKISEGIRDPKIHAAIERNMRLAASLGVQGTPGFIIGDTIIPGAVGIDALKEKIAELRDGKDG